MNQKSRAFALLIGGALALSAFAACAPDSSDGTTEQDAASDVRICYDNLGGGYLDDSVTKASVAGVTVVAGYNAAGTRVDDAFSFSIATYADGVFTAVSAGTVVYRTADGELGTVEVVPAYVTDPGYQYSGGNVDFDESGDAISSIASNGIEEGYSVLSDGAMVSSFGPQSLISLMFDSSCLRTTDISGYTHIRLTVRNMTDVEAPGLSLTVYAEGFDAELGSTGTIPAGETAVIDLQLPEAAADKFAALKMLYLLSDADTLDESTYTYRIEDIYAVSKQ